MKCGYQVRIKGMNFYRTRQCKNSALYGDFCGKHTPEALERRQKRTFDKQAEKLKKAFNYYINFVKKKQERRNKDDKQRIC